ncbi:transcriptional regulator, LacI family [Paenibacillaceae bacterium GAS479]|nr:transcriptional regulator, LacI family [Paenibacillaceae bacterium GAS479]
MTTLKDVAERVGVSISTVSRVVNNEASHSVRSETRKKIWDAVTELGYQPTKSAKNQESDKKNPAVGSPVGCILAVTQNKYNHPYFSGILEGIEKGIAEMGYELAFVQTVDDLRNPAVMNRILYENTPDGLILVEGLEPDLYAQLKKRIPHLIGVDVSDPGIPRITYDRVEAAKVVVQHLLQQGHRRIAFIGGSGLSHAIEKEKRYRGYREALWEADISVDPDWVIDCGWDVEKSYQRTKELLKNKENRPTAIFAASDMIAISAMRAANESGMQIPDDIAFAGIDNIEMSAYSSPPLTTVHIPKLEIGNIAAKTLIDYIGGRYPVPVKISVPFELKIRQSSVKEPRES